MLQVQKQRDIAAQIELTYEIFENLLQKRIEEEPKERKGTQSPTSDLSLEDSPEKDLDEKGSIVGNPWDQITRRKNSNSHPRCKKHGIFSLARLA